MHWAQILNYLHLVEYTIATDGGQLVVEGAADEVHERVVEAIRDQRADLVAILAGGHAWAPCEVCGVGTLTPVRSTNGKPRTSWPDCRMTPRCRGHHTPRSEQVAAMLRFGIPAPPAQATPPPKPQRQRLLGERPTIVARSNREAA